MIKKNLLTVIFVFSVSVLFAEQFPDSDAYLSDVPAEVREVLKLNGHVFRYDEESSGPLYLPATGNAAGVMRMHRSMNPEVMVEALYSIPYPDDMPRDPDKVISELYRLGHKVSGISGAMYYSERRKKYDVLFTDVYAVDNPEDRHRIPDPAGSSAGTGDTVFLHMKENALGRGYYRLSFEPAPGMLVVSMSNVSDLGFIIKAVKPEDLMIMLQIIPCSDTILVYGYCGVVLQNDDFVNLLLDPYYAFYRRMTAMETWLYNSLHNDDALPPLYQPLP